MPMLYENRLKSLVSLNEAIFLKTRRGGTCSCCSCVHLSLVVFPQTASIHALNTGSSMTFVNKNSQTCGQENQTEMLRLITHQKSHVNIRTKSVFISKEQDT